MAGFRSIFASLVCISYWFGFTSSYAIGYPSSLFTFQQIFQKPGRISLGSFDFSWGLSKRPAESIVPTGLEDWIQQQRKASFKYLLDNIAPSGSNAKEAAPGVVIASPSKKSPNYFYMWVRDAAITMGDVIEAYEKNGDETLKSIIESYTDLQGTLQNTFNPSGGYTTGGLGEPKFQVDGAPFTENWARPQRDGPALRALALMRYVRTLNESDPSAIDRDWLRKVYDGKLPTNSIIKADLEYISHSWNITGFDLWEEVKDLHFFTAIVQRKALVEGRDLAVALGDSAAANWYESQQLELKKFLESSFWNKERGHLVAFLDTRAHYRTGIDCGLLLGSLHGGQEDLFPPWSDQILASLAELVADMAERYPINKYTTPFYPEEEDRLRGVGIGRYPEDSEGHPWFLCTSSVSNILYNSIEQFVKQGHFDINDTNLRFFSKLHPNGKAVQGRYHLGDPWFRKYLVDMFKYADSFLNVIRWHATVDGRLSEQFSRHSGFQRGAEQLTWSHGSYIGAATDRDAAREGLLKSGVVA
ncbi:Six-hairpin glycosidase-like protein [Trichophaea hybrida]|nr:Six-hairpin glycosidase-like protein [Trichophaea hybrida]